MMRQYHIRNKNRNDNVFVDMYFVDGDKTVGKAERRQCHRKQAIQQYADIYIVKQGAADYKMKPYEERMINRVVIAVNA